jgi:membrane protease YdiL (CAAX protease family)
MKRSGLITFYVLVYVLAWGLGAAFAFAPKPMEAMFGPVQLWNPIVFAAIWLPTILGLVCALAFDGVAGLRELLARIFRWRIPLRWYVISTVGVAVLALSARFVQAEVHHTAAPPVLDFATWPHLAWYGISMLVVDPGPIGEDPGWRGFALPRMLNEFSPWLAATLLGVIWGIWHLPAFYFSGMPQAELPILQFMIVCIAQTVVMSWIAINARGAVIPAILVHWAANRFNDLSVDGATYCAIAWTIAAVAVVLATRGQIGVRDTVTPIAPRLP